MLPAPKKIIAELLCLGLYTTEERSRALLIALDEISPEHYAGRRPPEKSYEKEVQGMEMFAFCWPSSRFRRVMYFKFCVTKRALFVLSFHQSRVEE